MVLQMQTIESLAIKASSEIDKSMDIASLDSVRVKYLGKKGKLTAELKKLGQLPAEERSNAGKKINEAKKNLLELIHVRRKNLEDSLLEKKLIEDSVDVSLPGRGISIGGRHPVSKTQSRIEKIFINAGFGVRSGPEIEDEF